MRTSLKITISILIATIIFALFTSFAYSGLFLYIESKFYNPRLREEYKKQLLFLNDIVARYHQLNIDRYSIILNKEYICHSFLTRQLPEDILKREEDFRNLKANYPFFAFCRLIGEDGKRIHYSTLESDIKEKKAQSIIYFNFNQVEKYFNKEILTLKGEQPKIFINTENKQIIYSFSIVDNYDIYKGSAIIYISIKDLNNYLLNVPSFTFQDISLIGNLGLLFNFPDANSALIENQILKIWQVKDEKVSISELPETINKESFLLFSIFNNHYGFISLIIPSKKFQMNFFSQMILLVSFFLTVFLTVFLLLNLKQDVNTVLAHRIKRFQIEFVKEFIESKESINWEKWCQDLNLHSYSIKNKIKGGLGKIKKEQEVEIDKLINKSWEEIVTVFTSQSVHKPIDNSNLKHIENMLQQMIQHHKFINKEVPYAADSEKETKSPVKEVTNIREENSITSAIDALDEILEARETPGAVLEIKQDKTEPAIIEEVQELETLEESEENEGIPSAAKKGIISAKKQVIDVPEELEELTDAEEVLEVADLEELTDTEVAVAEDLKKAVKAVNIEEIEEVEKVTGAVEIEEETGLEELIDENEPEEIEALEEVAEVETIEISAKSEVGTVGNETREEVKLVKREQLASHSRPDQRDEGLVSNAKAGLKEPEELEELEALPSLIPLPPELYERLEYLPLVDEAGQDFYIHRDPPEQISGSKLEESGGQSAEDSGKELTSDGISIHKLKEVRAFIEDLNTFIVAEDGVFKIRNQLYEQPKNKQDNQIFELGSSVPVHTEEIFSQKNRSVLLPVPFSEKQGLKLDNFFNFKQIIQNDISQQKAMITMSKRINAIAMALLFFKNEDMGISNDKQPNQPLKDQLVAYQSLGFDEDSVLQFKFDEPFVQKYLLKKLLVLIDKPLSTSPELKNKFTHNELKMIKKGLFLPASLEGNDLFVFFGFCIEEKLSIKKILTNLRAVAI